MYTSLNEYTEDSFAYKQDQIAIANLIEFVQSHIKKTFEEEWSAEEEANLRADLHLFFDYLTYSVKKDYCLNFFQLFGNKEDFQRNISLENARGALLEEVTEYLKDNFDLEKKRITFEVEEEQEIASEIFNIVLDIEKEDQSFSNVAAVAGKNMLATFKEQGSLPITYWPNDLEVNIVIQALRQLVTYSNVLVCLHHPFFKEFDEDKAAYENLSSLIVEARTKLSKSHNETLTLFIPGNTGAAHYVALVLVLFKNDNIKMYMQDSMGESASTIMAINFATRAVMQAGYKIDHIERKLIFTKKQQDGHSCAYFTIQAIAQNLGIKGGLGSEDIATVQARFTDLVFEAQMQVELNQNRDEKTAPRSKKRKLDTFLNFNVRPISPLNHSVLYQAKKGEQEVELKNDSKTPSLKSEQEVELKYDCRAPSP